MKTFENFDKFDSEDFADRLTKVIDTFFKTPEGAYVLSLNAKYGSGKTEFLEMWKNKLREQKYTVLTINAWENDFCNEPLISIASAILEISNTPKASTKIKNALHGAIGATALVANGLINHATGIDVYDIATKTEQELQNEDIRKLGQEIYKEFDFKKKAYSLLQKTLEEYIEELEKQPLIILIDELDRARPNYAISFLEAIKHIFSVSGICFVIATDREQLEQSAKQLFGDIDFNAYYKKFVSREVTLPKNEIQNTEAFIRSVLDELQASIPTKLILPVAEGKESTLVDFASNLSTTFDLTRREMKQMTWAFFQYVALEQSNDKPQYLQSWFEAALILSTLQTKNPQAYHDIGNQALSPATYIEFIEEHCEKNFKSKVQSHDHNSIKRTFLWPYLSCYATSTNAELLATHLIKLDNPQITEERLATEANRYIDSMERTIRPNFHDFSEKSLLNIIYTKMEEWRHLFV